MLRWLHLIGVALFTVLTIGSPAARAQQGGSKETFTLLPVALQSQEETPADTAGQSSQSLEGPAKSRQEVETLPPAEERLPLRISLGYYLYSDYVWRGKNLSEYDGEGREKPNHQMTTSIAWVTECYGIFGFNTFLEFYADQERRNPFGGGQNLQEVDYVVWWQYYLKAIATDLRLSYTYDIFPNSASRLRHDRLVGNNNDDRTMYWTAYFEHNDAWMWKWLFPDNEGGVFNPNFLLSQDFGAMPGVWMEFGFFHKFPVPGVENLTITPGWKLYTDCSYWSKDMKLAGDQWSLVTAYNLSPLLCLPKWAGDFIITGELYYNNAFGNLEDDDILRDDLWGGMSVRWNWGA